MKTLRVNDLLIVEAINHKVADTIIFTKYGLTTFTSSQFICKGSEALERFPDIKETIESQGYYWGKNNLPIPSTDNINWFKNQINGDFSDRYTSVFNWYEAQSKTFNLEQTLIFKLVP